MSAKKKILIWLLLLLLIATVAIGVMWHMQHYRIIDFRFYPKNAHFLDLREEEISIRHYEKVRKAFPASEILWNVPFQGVARPEGIKELTVSELSDKDLEALKYLPELERIQAEECTDYDQLMALQELYPQIALRYFVKLDGTRYPQDAKEISVSRITEAELENLPYLQQLHSVTVTGGESLEGIAQLQAYCRSNELEFGITLGGKAIADTTQELSVRNITDAELNLLQLLPQLKSLHLSMPKASAENIQKLRMLRPEATVTWEQEICGKVFSSDAREIDLSGAQIRSLDLVDKGMAYFPDAESVFLDECGIDNETIAAYRERAREKYKVVWTVTCGSKLKSRTDATSFMPVREHVYYFHDHEAYNLRYCEEMVCIDIGHMSIHEIDFVEFMPNLTYLILAHTQVQYIEPIRSCKNLKFLELDWSPVRDLSPLVDCTGLEDLNVGKTWASMEPLKQMTWLNNLWMISASGGHAYQMTEALPNTKVVSSGDATVASGWRNLPNYFAMRDELGMHYMTW